MSQKGFKKDIIMITMMIIMIIIIHKIPSFRDKNIGYTTKLFERLDDVILLSRRHAFATDPPR